MDIRQFVKRKSISDSRSAEKIQTKDWELRSNQHRLMWYKKGKAFCERPLALHRQQPEKDKQNFDISPPGKNPAHSHGPIHNNRIQLCSLRRLNWLLLPYGYCHDYFLVPSMLKLCSLKPSKYTCWKSASIGHFVTFTSGCFF